MRVIAYTYDAAVHCRDCAVERFGPGVGGLMWIGAVFDTDERIEDLHCDDCRELIGESTLVS